MATNRLIIILALTFVLTILSLQNWLPALPLIFLGVKTQPLPLAIWILLSFGAGVCTSWLIGTLNKFSSYLIGKKLWTYNRSDHQNPSTNIDEIETVSFKNKTTSRAIKEPKSPTRFIEDEGDWGVNESDDWDFKGSSIRQRAKDHSAEIRQEYRNEENPLSSNSINRSNSSYSYGPGELKNIASDQTESIYDADYRVIIPPHQPETNMPLANKKEDDWSFFEDEEDDPDNDNVYQSSPKHSR